MKLRYLLAASAVSLSAGAMVAAPAAAQQITSGIEGQVTDDAGMPLAGATVTITDTRTGQERVLTSDGDGSFQVRSLQPGGPYTVTTTAAGYEGQTVEDVFVNISGNTRFTFALPSTLSVSTPALALSGAMMSTGFHASAAMTAATPSPLTELSSRTFSASMVRLSQRVTHYPYHSTLSSRLRSNLLHSMLNIPTSLAVSSTL